MEDRSNVSAEGGLRHVSAGASISLLELLCGYLEISEAEYQSALSEQEKKELRERSQKQLSDVVDHVNRLSGYYEDETIWKDGHPDEELESLAFLVSKKRLHVFRDVTTSKVLNCVSRMDARYDTERSFYNVYVIWLQCLSPGSMQWHFHVQSGDQLRFCAVVKDILRATLGHFISTISYLIRAVSILLEAGDPNGKEIKWCHNVETVKFDEVVAVLTHLLKFSFVTSGIPRIGWEFSNTSCEHGTPIFPSLELHSRVNTEHCNSSVLLSMPSSYITNVVCKALELSLDDSNEASDSFTDVVVLCLHVADTNCNETALDICYRIMLKCLKGESSVSLKRHSHALKQILLMRQSPITKICLDAAVCVELYLALMVYLLDERDIMVYEMLERLMKTIMLQQHQEAAVAFLQHYPTLLEAIPLACASTLLELFELVIITPDVQVYHTLVASLFCLDAVFAKLSEDAIAMWFEFCHWFMVPYLLHLEPTEIDAVNDAICVLHEDETFGDLRLKCPTVEKAKPCTRLSQKEQDDIVRLYTSIWNKVCEEGREKIVYEKIMELKSSLEAQLRTAEVAPEGVLKISQYYSWLIALKPETKTYVESIAPIHERDYAADFEDVRNLLLISVVNEEATHCSGCEDPLWPERWYSIGATRFACQLCTETCCMRCQRCILLRERDAKGAELTSFMCQKCSDYVTRLKCCVVPEPATEAFIKLTDAFNHILASYKDLQDKLFQLQGYIKLFNLHNQLKEPLPTGTRDQTVMLLSDAISQRKRISDIKREVTNYSIEENENATLMVAIRQSLTVLANGILYKTIPKINEVVYSLQRLHEINKF